MRILGDTQDEVMAGVSRPSDQHPCVTAVAPLSDEALGRTLTRPINQVHHRRPDLEAIVPVRVRQVGSNTTVSALTKQPPVVVYVALVTSKDDGPGCREI